MRLLEPINGIKTIQGHYMVNIIFFLVIFTIDKDIEHNLRDTDAYNMEKLGLETDEHQEPDIHVSSHIGLDDDSDLAQLSSYDQYLSQFY